MNYYERALELNEDTIANRRHIHSHAEVGVDLPETKAFVWHKLEEYGLQPQDCGHGITCTVGTGDKCILLRADMDALPMPEESGLDFACSTGEACHACGHDFHAAMLLTAARLLKENEAALKGTVKFMFQTGEECFQGAADMLEAGVLESPAPAAAFAFHVAPGQMPVGLFMYNGKTTMMYSVDGFKIDVHGKGAHGAYPQESIDPINVAVHIYQGLQSVIAREANPAKACIMTVGKFSGGTANNIIPDSCTLEGTIRTNDKESREKLVARMREVAVRTAEAYGATAEVIMTSSCPCLVNDEALTNAMVGYLQEQGIPGMVPYPGIEASASEDFAMIAERVPSTFMYLSAGYMDERGAYSAHNPKVQFNEDVCLLGAASLAYCATRWLEDNA